MDSGIDMIDTALAYGDGHSETLVGEVVRDIGARDWAVVATKIPPLDKKWPAREGVSLGKIFPPEYVQQCVERSLRNMRAEVLVIEQLHVWRDEWLDSDEWKAVRATMERMVKEGKVLHWGVSINSHEPETALRILEDPLIETVQVIYNIFDPSAATELFAKAKEHDVGVIVRCPFDEGALTGKLDHESKFPARDFRSWYFRDDRLLQLRERLAPLRELLGDHAQTLAELALRFCLIPEEVGTVIPGMRRPEHMAANLGCADGAGLPAEIIDRLAELAWDKNWYR